MKIPVSPKTRCDWGMMVCGDCNGEIKYSFVGGKGGSYRCMSCGNSTLNDQKFVDKMWRLRDLLNMCTLDELLRE